MAAPGKQGCGGTFGWMDRWMGGWTVGGFTYGWMDGWMDGLIYVACFDGCMLDGWMAGLRGGWIDRYRIMRII